MAIATPRRAIEDSAENIFTDREKSTEQVTPFNIEDNAHTTVINIEIESENEIKIAN